MKRIKLLLLIFAMLISMMVNAEVVEIDGIRYEILKKVNKAEVVESATFSGTIVVIPPTVTYDGIECNVTSIGDDAFNNCRWLTSVTIPNSVTSIGKNAFYN